MKASKGKTLFALAAVLLMSTPVAYVLGDLVGTRTHVDMRSFMMGGVAEYACAVAIVYAVLVLSEEGD
jgi:hypothetical protein